MYTQFMVPEGRAHVPVVLIHGGGLSGSCYETTPDGRTGWNEYFVRRRFPVYLPDQVGRGRSGFNPTNLNKVTLGQLPPSDNPKALVETREDAWQIFRFGPSFGIPFPGEQFPVEHADDLAKQVIPDINASLPVANPTYANLAALADKLKGAVLVGHSESSCFPFQAALVHPDNIKGIISIEGCSMALTPEQVSILKKIPALELYGDNIAAGSFPLNWSASVAASQTFVQTLKSAGGDRGRHASATPGHRNQGQ
jgi:pimeloyl-ACP methyl ester carboxylesterase